MPIVYLVLGIALGAWLHDVTGDWRQFADDQQPLVEAHKSYFDVKTWSCQ